MEIIKIKNKEALSEAIKVIRAGGVIICPTDTVYGFLADASNKKAVNQIYRIKKRPRSKPLPIFVKDLQMAESLADIDSVQEKMLNRRWPGKYTFILNRKKSFKVYGVDKDTIAMRVPKYNFLNKLLKKIEKPLVQTSVNISGQQSLINIEDIIRLFNTKNELGLIVDGGNLLKNKPSIIIDLTKDKIEIIRK